jgi:small subunit ribosomal protein S27Ae
MAEKKEKKGKEKKSKGLYEVREGKLTRKNPACPRCGEGTFMAEHTDRFSCGKCGYTKWKKK